MRKTLREWFEFWEDNYSDFKIEREGVEIDFNRLGILFNENIRGFCLKSEWKLVEEPIHWKDAIDAWLKGETVNFEKDGIWYSLHKDKFELYDNAYNRFGLYKEDFIEGNWYIRGKV